MLNFVNILGTNSLKKTRLVGSVYNKHLKHVVLTPDLLKYFTAYYLKKKHISKIKRSLPDTIQKCVNELIWVAYKDRL